MRAVAHMLSAIVLSSLAAMPARAQDTGNPAMHVVTYIEATPASNAPLDQLEQAIYAEIERLKDGPIADAEIERARNGARRRFTNTVSTSLSLARNLAEFALYYGDPGRINTRWDRLATFNAADVQRVAKAYLTPDNRTVVISHPKAAAGRGGAQ